MKTSFYTAPVRLKSERAWRTYHGGQLIDEMQGLSSSSDTHFPEDWIMSTVRAINAGREEIVEGLNRLADADMTLKDFIAADPAAALGGAHVAKWGESPAVLVKLIDAAERLGIQCHPDKDRARQFFGSPFGKTECWHIVGGRAIDGEKPCVYMGFKPGVTRDKWKSAFEAQDGLLDMLHRIPVAAGDFVFVDGGMPHAIGGGCFMIELQEPSDLMVVAERVTPSGRRIPDAKMHGGVGWKKMFEVYEYEGLTYEEVCARYVRRVAETAAPHADMLVTQILGPELTDKFSMWRVAGGGILSLPRDRAVAVVTEGAGEVNGLAVKKGDRLVVADERQLNVAGAATLVVCA